MKYSKNQKSLSQPVIDLLSRMSKLVDQGLSPVEAVEWMTEVEPEWRCSRGYRATKGGLRQARQRLERRVEMMKQVNNGVTTFINNKPKNRYKVIVFANNMKKLVWIGDCKTEAYERFLNARYENIKKCDVVLYDNNSEVEIYNAQEDADHDQGEE